MLINMLASRFICFFILLMQLIVIVICACISASFAYAILRINF